MIMAKDSHGNYVKIEDIKQQDCFKGISPIDFKSNGDNLKNYRIYGNTVNGESVGDRTGNLFDGELTGGYHLSDTTGLPVSYVPRFATLQPITINQSEYCLTYNSTTDLRFMYSVFNDDTLIRRVARINDRYLQSGDAIDTTGGNKIYFAFYNNDQTYASTEMISNIMLNTGSTALPYEPYGYKVPVKIEGKNLLQNTTTSRTIDGLTFTVNTDGSVTCNGRRENTSTFFTIGSVTTSGKIILSGCPSGGSSTSFAMRAYSATISNPKVYYDIGDSCMLNTPDTYNIDIRIQSNYACDNLTFYPMIRKADIEDDTYEPYHAPVTIPIYLPEQIKRVGEEAEYIDFGEQKQHRVRKNLLKNTATSCTKNNVTFTINQDYSVTCNGRAPKNLTATLFIPCYLYANVTYKLTGTPQNTNGKVQLDMRDASGMLLDPFICDNNGNGAIFSVNSSGDYKCGIRISPNYNCENITFYPMIRKADIQDDTYEPYIEDIELDVTLPAISTLSETNIFSINTNIKPSKVWGGLNDPRDILYVKDKLGNILFSKYYEIEDEPPLTYKAKKAGMLKDYRIYGNTVNGENVGDLITEGEHAGEYEVPVTVEGKNLFDKSKPANILKCYLSVSTLVSNVDTRTIFIECKPSTTYTVSKIQGERFAVGWSDKLPAPRVELQEKVINYNASSITITTGLTAKYLVAYIYNAEQDAPITADEMIASVQIEKGSTATPYEPYHAPVTTPIYLPEPIKMVGDEAEYIDYAEQKMHRVRKNLLKNTATSQTINGVTFTVNSDKSVTCNGTASKLSFFSVGIVPEISCILNGCPQDGSASSYILRISDSATGGAVCNEDGNGAAVNVSSLCICAIRIASGYTCNNLTFYPMIRKADIEDDTYEPYIENTDLDVTLPALPTLSGTNTLSVNTNIKPSDIYLKGKIEKKPKIDYKIYYYSQDGQTLLYTESVPKGSNGMYSGTPTKMADPQYTYTFAGWSSSTGQTTATPEVRNNIQNDKNVYAAFSQTLNTYTVYFYNESDTPIETVQNVPYGGTATYPGATPTSSQAGYIFSGWSPSNTNITADTSCYAQFVDEDMYESISDTWSEIIANVSNGTYSTKYHIGDTKKIDLGTEGEVIMTIVGIDTDDLADNSGKAPITWISKQLLKTDHRMNPSYQSGTEGTGALGGWEKTEMRSYLKETVKPLIPETVRNAIKPVKKYSRIYNVSGSPVNDVLTTEDVWIPSYKELFGSGLETLGPTYSTAFPDDASRIKRKAGSSAAWWWLRSAYISHTFNIIQTDGSYGYNFANYSTGGVALGFCT